MPIVLNGSGTVTGISVGGLPDGIIQAADLASGVGGKILQVVQTQKVDASSVTGTTFTKIPGTDQSGSGSVFCVKITPCLLYTSPSPRD